MLGPFDRDRADRARDELRVDAHVRELRQKFVQLAIPDERFAADDGEVKSAVLAHEPQDFGDQRFALVVRDLAQVDVAAEMIGPVGIAAGAAQRTFSRNLDGQVRGVARQDAAPCGNNAFQSTLPEWTAVLSAIPGTTIAG